MIPFAALQSVMRDSVSRVNLENGQPSKKPPVRLMDGMKELDPLGIRGFAAFGHG